MAGIGSLRFGIEGFVSKFGATSDNKLYNLSKVNLFVGSNNSGKSRFLRHLFLRDVGDYFDAADDFREAKRLYDAFRGDVIKEFKKSAASHVPHVEVALPHPDSTEIFQTSHDYKATIQGVLNRGCTELRDRNIMISLETTSSRDRMDSTLASIAQRYLNDFPPQYGYQKLYIPVLRGLRPFSSDKSDCFRDRTMKDYFSGEIRGEYVGRRKTDDVFRGNDVRDMVSEEQQDKEIDLLIKEREQMVFTGLEMYDALKQHLLGSYEQRALVRDFEIFLSRAFFEARPVTLIPREGTDVVYVKIGNEDDFPIYSLGDGIQQILILTFPLFMRKNDKILVFIDEPEIHMHPGLQKTFFQTISGTEGMESFQYFITTHSNHLLDLSLDQSATSIYTFRKDFESVEKGDPQFIVEKVENTDFSSLELLGVKQSSVFLSNCTIWVEGITDRLYLRKYLEIMMSKNDHKYIEGIHYSFAEYGGANITHWDFINKKLGADPQIDVKRLCGNYFVVADNDDAQGEKYERLERMKTHLEDRFYKLEGREIENLISAVVLKKLLKDDAMPVDYSQYHTKKEKMGRYIRDEIYKGAPDKIPTVLKTKKVKEKDTDTLADKVELCRETLKIMDSLKGTAGLLSKEAEDLALKLLEFIETCNDCSKK